MKTSSGCFKKFFILYLVLSIFLVPKAEAQQNSSPLIYSTCIEKNLQLWVKYWKQFNEQFDISRFQLEKKNLLKYENPQVFDSVQLSAISDKSLCFFSQDSGKMADIYSYRCKLKVLPDGTVSIGWGEPDTGVKLVDLVKDSIYTFLTSGTLTEYQDACWYDSSTVIVAGCNENSEQLNTYYPFYYVLDFGNNLIMLYKEQGAYKPEARNYIRYKYDVSEKNE